MKKITFSLAALAAGLLFAGCASVDVIQNPDLNGEKLATRGKTIAHLNCQNWGIYLFSNPLLTGSTTSPGDIAVLEDTVNVQSTLPVITSKSRELGASKLLDLSSQYSETGFIFYSRNINISGNSIK